MKIIAENEVIITTGGTSVGKKDFIPLILDELSEVIIHGISIKPGSPTTFAISDNKCFLGLPGLPVSSLISMAFFGVPVLLKLVGSENVGFLKMKAKIDGDFFSEKGRTDFLRVSLKYNENSVIAHPIKVTGSSLLKTLFKSDGIVIIDDKTERLTANTIVEVMIINKLVNS